MWLPNDIINDLEGKRDERWISIDKDVIIGINIAIERIKFNNRKLNSSTTLTQLLADPNPLILDFQAELTKDVHKEQCIQGYIDRLDTKYRILANSSPTDELRYIGFKCCEGHHPKLELSHFIHLFVPPGTPSTDLISLWVEACMLSLSDGIADYDLYCHLTSFSERYSLKIPKYIGLGYVKDRPEEHLEKVIDIREEYVESVFSALKGFFQAQDHQDLLALLHGIPIQGRVTFLLQQNLLADVFLRMHKEKVVLGPKNSMEEFLATYFQYTRKTKKGATIKPCGIHGLNRYISQDKEKLGLRTTPIELPFLNN